MMAMHTGKPKRVFTEAERREKVGVWLELRQKVGNDRAAREVGVYPETLRIWAAAFGMVVEPMDRAVGVQVQKGLIKQARSEEDWRVLVGDWIGLRREGMNSVQAARELHLAASTLERQAKTLGVEIPAELRNRAGKNVWEVERERERQKKFETWLELRKSVGNEKAAEMLGRSATAMRQRAKRLGVELPGLKSGPRKVA